VTAPQLRRGGINAPLGPSRVESLSGPIFYEQFGRSGSQASRTCDGPGAPTGRRGTSEEDEIGSHQSRKARPPRNRIGRVVPLVIGRLMINFLSILSSLSYMKFGRFRSRRRSFLITLTTFRPPTGLFPCFSIALSHILSFLTVLFRTLIIMLENLVRRL
jgi:hypothetical protein